MTNEELAEARATKFADVNFNEPDNYGSEKEVGHFSYYTGFLAGLEASRPKWHDLRKNHDDLPDNTDNVLSDKGVIVYYNFTHACWVDERASVEIDDVKAWCEVPKYTEEVEHD